MTSVSSPFSRAALILGIKETLENQASLRENGPVITGQDWIDGRQAARLL